MNFLRVVLMTFALATIAIVVVACTNPRPGNSGDSEPASYCDSYQMQEINESDSNSERIRKLRENLAFQQECS